MAAQRREPVERVGYLHDARLCKADRPLGGGLDLLLTLPVDQCAEPKIKGDQKTASDKDTGGNRNEIPARKRAHSTAHPGVGGRHPSAASGAVRQVGVKAALSQGTRLPQIG